MTDFVKLQQWDYKYSGSSKISTCVPLYEVDLSVTDGFCMKNPMFVNSLEENCIEKYEIKGFPVHICRDPTYDKKQRSAIVYFPNGRFLTIFQNCYMWNTDSELKEKIAQMVYTDEELRKKPKTNKEIKSKKEFLTRYYHRQIGITNTGIKYFSVIEPDTLFDPVSNVFVETKYKVFVDHHIQVYSDFIKAIPPTIFPDMAYGQTPLAYKFSAYHSLIPFAKEDDPGLIEAKNYIKLNARAFVDEIYEAKGQEIIYDIVKEGLLEKSYMEELLEKANDIGDTDMVVLLLEAMKDTHTDKNRFDL